jgi:hypothetical protein
MEPRAVSLLVSETGVDQAAKTLYADRAKWNCLTSGIDSAQRDWLSIGIQLRPRTDAGASSEIDEAFVLAFQRSPAAVLEVVALEPSPSVVSIRTICEPALEPKGGYSRFYNSAETMLAKLPKEVTAAKVAACGELVRRAKQDINKLAK